MLVYRVLNSQYNYCDYCNEVEAYFNGALCALPSGTKNLSTNTFSYGELRYYHHFFVFAEDAFKFLLTRQNVENYRIGEFEINDDLVPSYSGFGVGYDFSSIPDYVLENCKSRNLKYEEIVKPALELAVPTQKLKDKYLLISGTSVHMSDSLREAFEMELYFKLSCLFSTGRLFELGDEKIKSCFREIYNAYKKDLYQEFLDAYEVRFDKKEKKFISYPTSLSEENIASRKRVLKKFHLCK